MISQKESKFDKDLSPDDIIRLQENIMKNQNMKTKEILVPKTKDNFQQKKEIIKEISKKEQGSKIKIELVDWVNFDCRNALNNDQQKPPSANLLSDDF